MKDHRDQDKQLNKILEELSRESKPDPKFSKMLQLKLREKFHAKYRAPEKNYKFSGFASLFKFKLQFASALVLVLFTSTTIYAYNSDEITNGNILYPLKKSVENVERMFANTPEEKTNYYNKMARRRMRELAVIERRGERDEATIAATVELLARAEMEASRVSEEIIVGLDTAAESPTITPPENSAKRPTEKRPEKPTKKERKSNPPIQIAKPDIKDIDVGIVEVADLAEEEPPVATMAAPAEKALTRRDKAIQKTMEIREEFEEKFEKVEIKINPNSDKPKTKSADPVTTTPIVDPAIINTPPIESQPSQKLDLDKRSKKSK